MRPLLCMHRSKGMTMMMDSNGEEPAQFVDDEMQQHQQKDDGCEYGCRVRIRLQADTDTGTARARNTTDEGNDASTSLTCRNSHVDHMSIDGGRMERDTHSRGDTSRLANNQHHQAHNGDVGDTRTMSDDTRTNASPINHHLQQQQRQLEQQERQHQHDDHKRSSNPFDDNSSSSSNSSSNNKENQIIPHNGSIQESASSFSSTLQNMITHTNQLSWMGLSSSSTMPMTTATTETSVSTLTSVAPALPTISEQETEKKPSGVSKFWKPKSLRKRKENYLHDSDIELPAGCHVEHIETLLSSGEFFNGMPDLLSINALAESWCWQQYGQDRLPPSQPRQKAKQKKWVRITVKLLATTMPVNRIVLEEDESRQPSDEYSYTTSDLDDWESESQSQSQSLSQSQQLESGQDHPRPALTHGPISCFVGSVYKRDMDSTSSERTFSIQRGAMVTSLQRCAPSTEYITIDSDALIVLSEKFDAGEAASVVSTFLPAFVALHHGNFVSPAQRYSHAAFSGQRILITGGHQWVANVAARLACMHGAAQVYVLRHGYSHDAAGKRRKNTAPQQIVYMNSDPDVWLDRLRGVVDVILDYDYPTNLDAVTQVLSARDDCRLVCIKPTTLERARKTHAARPGWWNRIHDYSALLALPNASLLDYKQLRKTNTRELEADLKYLFHLLSKRMIRPKIDSYLRPRDVVPCLNDAMCRRLERRRIEGELIVEPWRR